MSRSISPPKSSRSRIPDEAATRVGKQDLANLQVIHRMLRLLNEPLVGAAQLAGEVSRLTPLVARVTRRFVQRFPNREMGTLPEQMAALGNRDFEGLLLQYLEDLTILSAELEEP